MFVKRNDIRSVKSYFYDRLSEQFSKSEIKLIVRECVCSRLGFSFSQYLLSDEALVSESDLLFFRSVVKRLIAGEPFQYIIGHVFFYGIEIKVSPGVLIPRPETEELVDWIASDFKGISCINILDLCSGSGCISFALERSCVESCITAVEFSIEALNVMQQNKQNINSKVSLIHANLLNNDCWDLIPNDFFDVLVSNPPYITIDERKSMSDSVLNFEPELALFVPNEDPLLFYRVLIHKGYAKLKKGGKFFFELNPLFVEGVIELMCIANLVNITVKKDLQGKERMLMGQKL